MAHKLLGMFVPFFLLVSWALAGCGGGSGTVTIFEVVVENIAADDALIASDGTPVVIAFSPAVWAVHTAATPMYVLGQPAPGNGLQQMAEDGDSVTLIESLTFTDGVALVGFAATTEEGRGVLGPGETLRFQVAAEKGTRYSILLTFLQGNDLFVGFNDSGIPLFDAAGTPLSGDITSEVFLFDAGTEVNQEPGLGPDQVIRQAEPGTGERENGVVRLVDDGFTYPAVSAMLRITINPVQEVTSD